MMTGDSLKVIAAEHSAKSLLGSKQEVLSWVAKNFNSNDKTDVEGWLEAYAHLQAIVCHRHDILLPFTALDVASLPACLLQFLAPEATPDARMGNYYLERSDCASYHAALTRRVHLLDALLEKAERLPATLNYVGLQRPGPASPAGKLPASVDWGDALVGPAGLSLPALFGSCAAPVALLSGDDALKLAAKQQHWLPALARYRNVLATQGYASKTALEEGLSAAIVAGAINAVLRCADQLDVSDRRETAEDDRRHIKRKLQAHLSDLLDLCDVLALADRDSVLHSARDYYNNDRRRRAERLLAGYVKGHQHDAEAWSRLTWVLQKRGKHAAAVDACQQALALHPSTASLHQQLGDLQLQTLDFKRAHVSFGAALQHGGSRQSIAKRIDWLAKLQLCEQQAKLDPVVPTLTLTDQELKAQKWREEHIALGVKLFKQYGVLLIHQAFSDQLLEACHAEFVQRYAEYFTDKTHPHALRIGDKRYQISVALEGAFNDSGLYANPFIIAIMRRLLSDEFLLGCTVCATALPGAKGQHLHKDHRALFTSSADATPPTLPPFAITTMVPLVTLDEKIGTTSVKKGSQLLSQPDSIALPGQLPMVPRGSCFLMDLRLTHGGMANQTDRVRPIMNMVYQRYWFNDSRNFAKHPPLRVSAAEYQRIPQQHRFLFDWGTQPGPQVGR